MVNMIQKCWVTCYVNTKDVEVYQLLPFWSTGIRKGPHIRYMPRMYCFQ